jgi:hypothetical protein
MLKVS